MPHSWLTILPSLFCSIAVGTSPPEHSLHAHDWLLTYLQVPPLSSKASALVEDYVAWHRSSANQSGTNLLVFGGEPGLGDQLYNVVIKMLHHCVVSFSKNVRLRFEISGPHTPKKPSVWSAGVAPRIDIFHDPARATQSNQVIDLATHDNPCGGEKGEHGCETSETLISYAQSLFSVLLRPSSATKNLLRETFAGTAYVFGLTEANQSTIEDIPPLPAVRIGVNLRTYARITHSPDPLTLEKFTPLIQEYPQTKRLYQRLVEVVADCGLQVAEEAKVARSDIDIFITTDYFKFTRDLVNITRERLSDKRMSGSGAADGENFTGIRVSYVPRRPVHSWRAHETNANKQDYTSVWAQWFSLTQRTHICGEFSSLYLQSTRFWHHGLNFHFDYRDCLNVVWNLLNQFVYASAYRGESLEDAYRDALRRENAGMQPAEYCVNKLLQEKGSDEL